MKKFWCIAIAMSGPEAGVVALSTQLHEVQEMAVALAVSEVYRQTGSKLPVMGVYCREFTREYLVEMLRLLDEEEKKPLTVVPLPRIVGDVMQTTTEADLHPAERAALHQARADAFGQAAQDLLDKQGTFRMPMYECPNCGAAGPRPGPCSVCGTEKIHRHHQHQYSGDALGMNIKCIVCGEPAPPEPAA